MRTLNNVNSQPFLPQASSNRRALPIKRADAEPLSREDIQYDMLEAIFSDQQAAFTSQSPGDSSSRTPKKVTFFLREKMSETPEFAIDFAKIALLANVGRINTTMAFFPEMRTVLRSYHPIPSLQKTDANLQDAPRIKNCLKACLLSKELSSPPATPSDILAKGCAGDIPTTSVVNLIFVLSNHSIPVSKSHFEAPLDFLDLFLPVNASSVSRARAFLWLVYNYLESPSTDNPFADEFAENNVGKAPRLQKLTPEQRLLENVDTEEELQYGHRMAQYRSKFLQQQIADEEKDKQSSAGAHLKAHFRIATPNMRTQALRAAYGPAFDEKVHKRKEGDDHVPFKIEYKNTAGLDDKQRQGTFPVQSELTMLEYAWHVAISTDPLQNSDEEVDAEHVKLDYERRIQILNAKVRGKDLTPEP